MVCESFNYLSEHEQAGEGPADRAAPAALQLAATQRGLADVLGALSDDQYRQQPVGHVPSSVGGHVRHCLDHVENLLAAVRTGQLNYDHRQRGTDVELSPRAARQTIARQEGELRRLAELSANLPLQLTALLDPALPPVVVATTLGRELAFVLSHTVHHSALVAVMVKLLGEEVPERFGYAPATIAHLERSGCAR